MTYDDLRAELACMLDLAPDALGDGDNLLDLGLDSMRLMSLILDWEGRGIPADYSTLIEGQTLAQWALALGVARD